MLEGGNIFICFALAFNQNQKQAALILLFSPPTINQNEKKRVFFLNINLI
jgi:hypothetical protein